jgi:hypothetical protein
MDQAGCFENTPALYLMAEAEGRENRENHSAGAIQTVFSAPSLITINIRKYFPEVEILEQKKDIHT